MTKFSQDCLDQALKQLINFKQDDIEDYIKDVFRKAGGYENLKNTRAFDQAIKDINNERMESYWEDVMTKTNNVIAFNDNAKKIKSQSTDLKRTIWSAFKRVGKLGDNIYSAQNAMYEKLTSRVLNPLDHEEVQVFSSGDHDANIVQTYDGKKTDSPLFKKISDLLKDYFLERNTQLIRSGAMRLNEIQEDRSFRAIHDQTKVMTAGNSLSKLAGDTSKKKYTFDENKNIWTKYIKSKIDMNETFRYTDAYDPVSNTINETEADKILHRIFDNISTGKNDIFTKSRVINDREALEKRSRMFFHWKSLSDLYDYNKIFGQGNLFQMMVRDMRHSSNRIGLAQRYGSSPESMYLQLKQIQQEVSPMSSKYNAEADLYFKTVAQQDSSSIAPKWVNFMSNMKAVMSMARLALVGIDSISDAGYQAAFAQRFGVNHYEALGTHLSHLFNAFPTEDRKRIAKLMRSSVDAHLGYLGRWTDQNNLSSMIQKVSSQFFKINLLEAYDKGAKLSNLTLMAKSFAHHSGKRLPELNHYTKQYISKFLDEHEWDLLRKNNKDSLFTTDNVDSLSESDIKTYRDKYAPDRPLSMVRDDLYRKVHAMFMVNAENTVLTPGIFEKAFLSGGLQKGTPIESFVSMVTQFKYYPLAYIDRVLVNGWRDADTMSRKLLWASSLVMTTMPLAYLSMFFRNLVMNKTMPQWNEMNVNEREKFLLQLSAPSLGFLSILLDNKTPGSMKALKLVSSPSTALLGNALSSTSNILAGEGKKAAKDMKNALNYIFPLSTTPILSPILDQAMGDKAYLEPGQRLLFGKQGS